MKVLLFIYLLVLCTYVLSDTTDSSDDATASTITFSATIYDQAPAYMTHSRFPADWWSYGGWTDNPTSGYSGNANGSYGWSVSDFELPMWMYASVREVNGNGVVSNGEPGLVGVECNAGNSYENCGTLGTDGTPVYQFTGMSPLGTVQSPESFSNWFHSTSETQPVPFTFVLDHIPGTARTYQYSNLSFFPLDGLGWQDYNTDGTNNHNFAFCCKSHASFGYSGGEVFNFYGDDDLFVFLDNKLVIDLGGVHTQLIGNVSLDDLPWLVQGQNYAFDMFYCERHTTDSNIQITTSIQFSCPTTLDRCGVCGGDGQSCCTAADRASCNENNLCQNYTCGVTTACQYTNISASCNLGLSCVIDSCDPSLGCQHVAKVCDDNNACTQDTCNNATGCVYKTITCPSNQCYTGGCATSSGCYATPVNCGTSDMCTQYSCANATGCSSKTTDCDDKNACTTDSCNPSTGCAHVNITCNDGLACTIDTCNPSSGCVYTPVTCSGSVCQTSSCDTTTGLCTYANLTCADTSDCSVGSCPAPNQCYTPQKSCSTGGCDYIQKNCSTNNPCSIGSCTNATGDCDVQVVNPTGSCLPCGENACTWSDACNPYTCSADMQCVLTPFNCTAPNACANSTCVSSGGVASCSVVAISCAGDVATDACTPVTCDNTLGCINSTSLCQDYNPCTVDTCQGPDSCSNVVPADICDDDNVCTIDSCNSEYADLTEACQHTNITCTPPTACQVVVGCNAVNGCQFGPITCPAPTAFCLSSYCDNIAGCVSVPKTCVTTDANCYIGVCDNVTAKCTQKERSNFATITTNKKGGGTCFFVYNKKTVAALTAGAIAGIVIAGVIALALLAFGGKKGYDLWLAHNLSGTSGVKGNPLYTPSANSGTSPMYS